MYYKDTLIRLSANKQHHAPLLQQTDRRRRAPRLCNTRTPRGAPRATIPTRPVLAARTHHASCIVRRACCACLVAFRVTPLELRPLTAQRRTRAPRRSRRRARRDSVRRAPNSVLVRTGTSTTRSPRRAPSERAPSATSSTPQTYQRSTAQRVRTTRTNTVRAVRATIMLTLAHARSARACA